MYVNVCQKCINRDKFVVCCISYHKETDDQLKSTLILPGLRSRMRMDVREKMKHAKEEVISAALVI